MIASVQFGWLAATGTLRDHPLALRVRQVPFGDSVRREFPHLLVATWSFTPSDWTGLPTSEQYEVLEEYESWAIDTAEASGLGLVALVRTHVGRVQYFYYVADLDAAVEFLSSPPVERIVTELAEAENDEWREYDKAVGALKRE